MQRVGWCALAGLLAGALLAVRAAAAGQTRCTPRDAEAAEAMVDHIDSWAAVATAYRRYGQCDDGGIAEGYADAIGRLLVTQWATLPRLAALSSGTPGLEPWVLRHVDTTLDTGVLETIHRNATASCPAGATRLCGAIAAASARASRPR